jgi:hypothetical protein
MEEAFPPSRTATGTDSLAQIIPISSSSGIECSSIAPAADARTRLLGRLSSITARIAVVENTLLCRLYSIQTTDLWLFVRSLSDALERVANFKSLCAVELKY